MSYSTRYGAYPKNDMLNRDSLTSSIMGLYDTMATQYQPGGNYLKGIEEQLARRKKGALASGMQSLVSSGMAGTTQAAGLGTKFEEEVGMPTMAAAETDRIGKLTSAMMGKANFMQQLLQDTPERVTTRRIAPMSEGILSRGRDRTTRKTTTKQTASTHTGRRMFTPLGGRKTSTPTFSQAFVGDPSSIGLSKSGVYSTKTGDFLNNL